jgi:hypothetical protein
MSEWVGVNEILRSDDGRLEAFDVTGHVGVSLIRQDGSSELFNSNDMKQEASGVTDRSIFFCPI